MTDPRITLAAELRAAGLREKADELLRSIVAEQTGTPERGAIVGLGDKLKAITATIATARGRRRARPGIGRARRKVAALLTAQGFEVEPEGIMCSVGWNRSVHKQHDDTTVTWEAYANHKTPAPDGHGGTEEVVERVHLFSWCRLTDCARGLHVDPLHGRLQQCVTARISGAPRAKVPNHAP